MQFFKIAAYVQVANYMAWCIMRLVHFCPYINGLRLALVGVAYQAVLCGLGLHERLEIESVSVFDGLVFISVDVKYIIHYRRICKFICSL